MLDVCIKISAILGSCKIKHADVILIKKINNITFEHLKTYCQELHTCWSSLYDTKFCVKCWC